LELSPTTFFRVLLRVDGGELCPDLGIFYFFITAALSLTFSKKVA